MRFSLGKDHCNTHTEELAMENYQSNISETMQYNLSAVEMLRILGYNQPTSGGWFEKLKQDNRISLPKTYTGFMELMADCPLLATSNLWVGKMEHRAVPRIPHTYYEELREMIDDREGRWSKRPSKHERALYELSQLPTAPTLLLAVTMRAVWVSLAFKWRICIKTIRQCIGIRRGTVFPHGS